MNLEPPSQWFAGETPSIEQSPQEMAGGSNHKTHRMESAMNTSITKKPRSAGTSRRSRHGIKYPSLPLGIIKKLSSPLLSLGGKKSQLDSEVLWAVSQASDWFFEQLGDDLGAYATHGGKRTIDESDVVTLMKRCYYIAPEMSIHTADLLARQRLLDDGTTTFSLAQRHLPRELVQDVKMSRVFRRRKDQRAIKDSV
jgi:histone H3/H4